MTENRVKTVKGKDGDTPEKDDSTNKKDQDGISKPLERVELDANPNSEAKSGAGAVTTTEAYVERMRLSPHDRRASLLTAERKLQIGRREEPSGLLSEDAKAARTRIIVGLALAIVVVVAVLILMVVLGRGGFS